MITVCILTKNNENTLPEVLESIRQFPEVLILDTGSIDNTIAIAKQYPNVRVYESPFCGFWNLRNKIASFAKHDWILALDSDEILTNPQEILSLELKSDFAYTFNRANYYRGKRIFGCGWNPDKVARLYNRKQICFTQAEVHESLETKNLISLNFSLVHTPYQSTADFLTKMQHYSTLFAKQYHGKRKSSLGKAIGKALFAFFRSYILKRGFLDGAEGFIISYYNANTTFYKYLKLAEFNASSIK